MLSKMNLFNAVQYPHLTEKSAAMHDSGKYTFIVSKCATKCKIKSFIELYYQVKVNKVNVKIRKGKKKLSKGRPYNKSDIKIAIVTLVEGNKIEFAQV